MNPDFDPPLLRAFIAVIDTGSFTQAAQRLHLTQSAISHQIRRLEEQVGTPLLYRTTRSLTLTPSGTDFLQCAKQIIVMLDSLSQRFNPSPVTGVVRFGVTENFLGDKLAHLLCQFGRTYPSITLDVNVSPNLDLTAMIAAGQLDLAVLLCKENGGDCGSILRKTRQVWVAADNFTLAPGASLPLALSPSPCFHRRACATALEETNLDWHIVFTSPSQHGLHAAVLSGLAITIMPDDDVRPGMRIVDGQYGLPPLPDAAFVLAWSEGNKTTAACEFGRMIEVMSCTPVQSQKITVPAA